MAQLRWRWVSAATATLLLHFHLTLAATTTPPASSIYAPSIDTARQNAFHIFNAVHAAMRQFGSSLKHNGLSFFLVTVPQGQLLYHGSHLTARPEGFEWLGFEPEHAMAFGQSWEPRIPPYPEIVRDQKRLNDDDRADVPVRGYFHTYQAARPLNLLYLDGMAAAKFPLGSLDSQDRILRGVNRSGVNNAWDELERVKDLCAIADSWALDDRRIDGFIRMETGFEIVYCHFEDGAGLDLLNIVGSPFANQTETPLSVLNFEWIRAAAQRYQGMPAGRVHVDYSSMVTAFAYPVNLTNPDPSRPDLPRFIQATKAEQLAIASRIREVVLERHYASAAESVNWQGVVDMIIARYASRLWQYASSTNVSAEFLLADIGTLINQFLDFRDAQFVSNPAALDRCIQHYIGPSILRPSRFTPEDVAIHTAIEVVAEDICTTLFDAYKIVLGEPEHPSANSAAFEAQHAIRRLVQRLDWSTWKECGHCENPDEICFVAMFPFGSIEDHFTPRCRNATLATSSLEYFMT